MKTFPFNYYPFEKEDILQYLNKKKEQGYKLLEISFDAQEAKFTKCEQTNYQYDISIHQDYGKMYEKLDKNALEYIDTCELSGWHHICTCNGVRFFYSDMNDPALPLSDDEISYESIEDKKKEFRNQLSKKRTLFNLSCAGLFILTGFKTNLSLIDICIIATSLIYPLIYLYLHYSKNINFRLKGLYCITWLIILIAILFFKFSYSLIFYLASAFTLLLFLILLKYKHPIFLEVPYLCESFLILSFILILVI